MPNEHGHHPGANGKHGRPNSIYEAKDLFEAPPSRQVKNDAIHTHIAKVLPWRTRSGVMDLLPTIMFGPAILTKAKPFAVFLIGGAAIALQVAFFLIQGRQFNRHFFRMAPTFAGLLWLIYGLYELQVQAVGKILTDTIRMDLFVLTPILYVFSGLAIISLFAQIRGRPGDFRRLENGKDIRKEVE